MNLFGVLCAASSQRSVIISPYPFGGVQFRKKVIDFSTLARDKRQLVLIVGAEGELSFSTPGQLVLVCVEFDVELSVFD
jgi:hypothetical protein